jgi:hypothetical protein
MVFGIAGKRLKTNQKTALDTRERFLAYESYRLWKSLSFFVMAWSSLSTNSKLRPLASCTVVPFVIFGLVMFVLSIFKTFVLYQIIAILSTIQSIPRPRAPHSVK